MAKLIRDPWVYKINNHRWRYMPRAKTGIQPFDYEGSQALPEDFPEKLQGAPPKLWVAWVCKGSVNTEPHWVMKDIETLFGSDWKPGKMAIFKNTASSNSMLWRVKHMIDIRPLTFPNGEPTEDDVRSIKVEPDGRCVIDKRHYMSEEGLKLFDPKKQMTAKYLGSQSARQWVQCKDVHEDSTYTPPNISNVA